MIINTNTQRFFLRISWLWFALFSAIPVTLLLLISFLTPSEKHLAALPFTFDNYHTLGQWIYLKIFWRAIAHAATATLICLLLSYPVAFYLSRLNPRWRNLALMAMIIPFWTSSLIRTYAIMVLIKTHGLINQWLMAWHIIHQPLALLYTPLAVNIGLIYTLLPFMLLPIYTNLTQLSNNWLDAARDLGANEWQVFKKIIAPFSAPAVITGIIMVFLPAMTLFYIPDILGGAKDILLGNVIKTQFLLLQNWPLGAATCVLLSLLFLLLCLVYQKINRTANPQAMT